MTPGQHTAHSHSLLLCALICAALVVLGCSPPPPPPVPPQNTPKASPPTPPKAQSPTPKAQKEDPKPQAQKTDLAFDESGALQMARGLKEAAKDSENLEVWLGKYSAFPFEVDGAHRAADLEALKAVLAKERPDLQAALGPHETCEARTHAQLLDGAPFHYVDRLGERPPKDELLRDLARMGLGGEDILVNCYGERAAGFFLIVGNRGGSAVLKALRM